MLVNTIAINFIFNLAIMGLYFAYCMPLVSRLCFGMFKSGVWYMGNMLSKVSALYSVIWMTVIFIILLFPSYPNPTPDEMNYAVAVLGFVLVFCVVYYWTPGFGGKTFFTGPVRTIDDVVDGNPDVQADIERKIFEDREGSVEASGSNEKEA
jgi:amino acid transporter